MRVQALIPDVPPANTSTAQGDLQTFAGMLDGIGKALSTAQRAEDAFAAGSGDLQTAVYERARADVALSVATAAAQRTAQALQSVLNMQV